MRTDAELDRRHDEIVAKFSGGISPKQWRIVTLESADDDGRIYPHSLADPFKVYSLLIGMFMDGLIQRRCRHDEAGPWFITDQGRKLLETERV